MGENKRGMERGREGESFRREIERMLVSTTVHTIILGMTN